MSETTATPATTYLGAMRAVDQQLYRVGTTADRVTQDGLAAVDRTDSLVPVLATLAQAHADAAVALLNQLYELANEAADTDEPQGDIQAILDSARSLVGRIQADAHYLAGAVL